MSWDVLYILSDFDVLQTTKENSSLVGKCQRVYNSSKCHGTVTKQTNPLQVDNVITYKSVATLDTCRRILNPQKLHSCKCEKIFKNIVTLGE
jgi:hypothetical protein